MEGRNKALFRFIKIAFIVMVILIVVYAIMAVCRVSYDYGYRLFTESAVDEEPGKEVVVQIRDGMSGMDIAKLLEQKGLVRDSKLFFLQLALSGEKSDIVPGVYVLSTAEDPDEIITSLTETEEETEEEEEETENVDTGEDDEFDGVYEGYGDDDYEDDAE
ncbi:MAG: aminodeoxychorismate lyase [Clostridiales bacterium]|nr:aminodeoxychorismate lyase [Clostridiales bacterium]